MASKKQKQKISQKKGTIIMKKSTNNANSVSTVNINNSFKPIDMIKFDFFAQDLINKPNFALIKEYDMKYGYGFYLFNYQDNVSVILKFPESEDVELVVSPIVNDEVHIYINQHGENFPNVDDMDEAEAFIATTRHLNWLHNIEVINDILLKISTSSGLKEGVDNTTEPVLAYEVLHTFNRHDYMSIAPRIISAMVKDTKKREEFSIFSIFEK